ncbi:hypothetical protein BAUCODRAFT_31563 [Baudoinia panamericana UAMH 10762]|uniref:Inactive metallocarboxypeptidase ECM14 n=1 Tax=Baudoinia panamericana (strain UAMH 10762) TaxID=717646 RepID=M2NIJ3_BAUPA|nr:uncharacterized protein BAUCODRAFT_31563 [Baudoinia panamericana UAMH 10762]EMC99219.1 hypothetical protein BAUCODRAFT_31563 [Baudoinia panamericana UAMH 10762]
MHLTLASLLALPFGLLQVVLAVPAPADYAQQHPLDVAALPKQATWKRLSDRIIESIWKDGAHETDKDLPDPFAFRGYDREVVIRFNVSTAEEARSLAEASETLLLDIWGFSQEWVDIRIPKDIVKPMLGLLPSSLQRSYIPLLRERELSEAVRATYLTARNRGPAIKAKDSLDSGSHIHIDQMDKVGATEEDLFFSQYRPLSVLHPWMRFLASIYPGHVQKINIGISAQGRGIPALRVGNSKRPNRETVLIVGGLHAREWISTSTVSYVAYHFVTCYGNSARITALMDQLDFVFVPTLNPDGYAYTWETDRLWRKNRQRTGLRFCQGIDLDRAFSFQWDGDSTTSGNPCSESFAGEQPFEAVEAKALADWAKNETTHNNVTFVGFLDMHSYAQEILYPYSFSCDEKPPGLENLEELAIGIEKAIRSTHGHKYEIMPACEGNVAVNNGFRQSLSPRMEASGGSILDWFYHEMHVRYAYQLKLRDKGLYGFLLPAENIIPTGEEILEAVLYFAEFLGDVYGSGMDVKESTANGKVQNDQGVPKDKDFAFSADDIGDDWVVIDGQAELSMSDLMLSESLRQRQD